MSASDAGDAPPPVLSPDTTVTTVGGSSFPVVGVGASAGGLEALIELFGGMPAEPGMAFLVAVHLDPHHESHLPEILGKTTPMPVRQVTEGMAVHANAVYLLPPNTNMALTDGHLMLTPRAPTPGRHMPIDHLFRSLAAVQGSRAIAIVLSGGGIDGALGMQAIKAEGGITFAQDEKSAKHPSMPRAAIHDGTIDYVLRPRDTMLTAAAHSDEEGEDIKVHWVLHDVSEARQTERAWQAEKNLADCLLETADIIILLVDEQGNILRCNPYTSAISGYSGDELHKQDWKQLLLSAEDREAGRQLLHNAKSTGFGKSSVLAFAARSGKQRRVLWSARKLDRRLLLIGQDVTELQEAQRQAQQAERLAAIGQVSAGLAHEGRNALQRIQACLSLLSVRLKDQPENLDLLERIQKAEDDLLRLFEDVRAYTLASRLQCRCCDLRQCWREAWNDLANLRPSAELHEDLAHVNPFCQADPFYLKQVFRNLLENALSSGANPVRILVECGPSSLGGEEAICIRLRDNGPGIPAAARPQLFEPFVTTKARGTGLGLAICKRIIEAHGGRIEASSDSASGAEMVITLPRREP